ncbi:MAG: hypothetical protein E7Y34_01265, partial [Mycoplasma sp.]|nr:hypothetical protein [Mycoplasma sp.]
MPIATFVYSYKSLEKLDGKLSKISNNLSKSGSTYFDRLLKTIKSALANNDPKSLDGQLSKIKEEIDKFEKKIKDHKNPLQEIHTLLEEVLGIINSIKKPSNGQQNLINELKRRLQAIVTSHNDNSNESYINKITSLIGQINDSLKPQPINSRTKSLLSDYILKTDWSTTNIPKDRTYLYSSSNLNRTETIGKIESSLSKIVQDNTINNIEFIPYTDIGIVRDSIEYFLKHHSFPRAYREKAIELLKKLALKKGLPEDHYIVNYNDLNELKKQGIASKFNVGFMQNNMNSDKLDPSWNAIPKNDTNQSGDWFQKERWDFWTKGENAIDSKDLTITFGPFANAFWHQAYLNNYDEFDLAQEIFKLSNHYGTKSFDFYFAPPYNRKSDTSYGGSTRLLAGALKIVKEIDKEFKIRLSIVSPEDGAVIPGLYEKGHYKNIPFNEKDHYKLVGDAIFPFFEFTRFLGVNFNLNLVTGYENIDKATGKGLEKLLTNTHLVWKKIINYYIDQKEKDKITDDLIWNRMSVTPWIGLRAEKPIHDFSPYDAISLREFAKKKQMHSISMFYITRDHPSKFIPNKNVEKDNNKEKYNYEELADKSPIDQNIRSGGDYKSFTYSKIFNGFYDDKSFNLEESIEKDGKEDKPKWAFDYDVLVGDNKDELIKQTLSEWRNENGGKALGTDIEDNDLTKDGNNISKNISEKEKLEFLGKHISWYSANPLRWDLDNNKKPTNIKNIENKKESNNKTKY